MALSFPKRYFGPLNKVFGGMKPYMKNRSPNTGGESIVLGLLVW